MRSNFIRATVVAALAIAPAFTANAADVSGKFAVRGIGTSSCSAMREAFVSNANATSYLQWILGYVTASNRFVTATYDILPTSPGTDMVGVVLAVCKAKTASTVEAATFEAIRALAPLRMTKESPIVSVNNGVKTVQVRADAWTLLQNALIRKNYLKGPVTNLVNTDQIKAIKSFQEKEGLNVSGLPDIDTFVRAVIKP